MNGTPRLPSAYPSTPSRSAARQNRATPILNGSPQRIPRATPPKAQDAVDDPDKGGPDPPRISLDSIDAPSQRLYVAGIYSALFFWRLYDFHNLTVDETESLWSFMKWVVIDGFFLFGLPGFRIPWLEWSSTTMTVLFVLHAIFDGILMFRIPVGLQH